jgi:hypothetical protein
MASGNERRTFRRPPKWEWYHFGPALWPASVYANSPQFIGLADELISVAVLEQVSRIELIPRSDDAQIVLFRGTTPLVVDCKVPLPFHAYLLAHYRRQCELLPSEGEANKRYRLKATVETVQIDIEIAFEQGPFGESAVLTILPTTTQ